jgi:cell division protein FtsQ
MAAMKPRRTGRGAPPPAPQPKKVARLAMLQMAGGRRGDAPARKSMLPGLLLLVGASLAGAMWMGGSLVDARNAVAEVADGMAAEVGFKMAVEVDGVAGQRAADVEKAVLDAAGRSLFAAEPRAIKQQIEQIDWVQNVRVARLWPNRLIVAVERREAVARWRLDGRTITIDAVGRPIASTPAKDASLPLLIGAGAGPAAAPALAALEARPALAKRIASLTFVHQRRWTVQLKNGPSLMLPARDMAGALDRFAAAEARYGLTARTLVRVDLRAPGQVVIAPAPELSGASGHSDA